MAHSISLKAEPRNVFGTGPIKRVRAAGKIPAVLYGAKGSRPLQISSVELSKALHSSTSENILVNLEVSDEKSGTKHLAIIQEVQHHPIKDHVLHVDLHEISENEELHVEVPVFERGEPAGVKNSGGILDHMLRTLKVACLPKDLPAEIVVDVSALELGAILHVREIPLPAGVRAMNAPDLPVFAVHAPTVVEEPAPGAAAAAVQPEVITAKKTEEGAAPAGKAEKK
jgi:large subunit ribosomal protein L25